MHTVVFCTAAAHMFATAAAALIAKIDFIFMGVGKVLL